jgi:hypothetical protein
MSAGAGGGVDEGGRVRHLNISSSALGICADELFTGPAVADGQDRGDEVQHFQGVRLVLVEKVHSVGNLHYVGAVRVRVVL